MSPLLGTFARYNVEFLSAPPNVPAWGTDHIDCDHYLISASDTATASGYTLLTYYG
jgi:hypothetical protein